MKQNAKTAFLYTNNLDQMLKVAKLLSPLGWNIIVLSEIAFDYLKSSGIANLLYKEMSPGNTPISDIVNHLLPEIHAGMIKGKDELEVMGVLPVDLIFVDLVSLSPLAVKCQPGSALKTEDAKYAGAVALVMTAICANKIVLCDISKINTVKSIVGDEFNEKELKILLCQLYSNAVEKISLQIKIW
ncbi:MAG: hypothetical protein HY973_03725 [Candidatus Kerfeldbacteria bacterium]|nr:hypothetical protein [Candidatus Kerfeldbacteria bacterium]